MSGDRYEAFEAFKAAAAAKLKLPIDNERVRLLGALQLSHEAMLERMIRGDNVLPDHVKTLTEAIEGMLPPEMPPSIEVKIVEGVVGIYTCKHCSARNELPPGSYQAPSKPVKPPSTVDVKVADKAAVEALPPPTTPKRKHPGSIHDQPGVPLKRYDEPWRTYGRTR
jgi:hypothetical protein